MSSLRFVYKILQKVAKKLGFSLTTIKKVKGVNNGPYEVVLPTATYAPWLSDRSFNDTYEVIKDQTLVDKYRCYEIWQLVEESAKLEGALIEIGVWRGGSGALIAEKARHTGIKDTVYLCDTFKGIVGAGERDSVYKGGEYSDTSKEIVEEITSKLKLNNVKILVGEFPKETGKLVTDKMFRFCHVDVDVYQSAKDIIEWLWPKLVIGGIVVFDDFGFEACDGITHFVNEERSRKDRIIVHNLNGHAVLIKIGQ